MGQHNIAVIPGDGIGPEVVVEGLKVLQAAADMGGVALEMVQFPWSCGYWLEHGHAMPPDALEILGEFDAIYLGAVGLPGQVPESVGVQDVVLRIRSGFDEFANVRPVQPIQGCPWYLSHRSPNEVDFVIIREATEGFYCNLGGRFTLSAPEVASILPMRPAFGMSQELALQTGIFSEYGCRRVIKYAFDLARERGGKKLVTSTTKSNALTHAMGMWDEIFEQVASEYPDCGHEWYHVDALAMRLVTNPEGVQKNTQPLSARSSAHQGHCSQHYDCGRLSRLLGGDQPARHLLKPIYVQMLRRRDNPQKLSHIDRSYSFHVAECDGKCSEPQVQPPILYVSPRSSGHSTPRDKTRWWHMLPAD
jgi:isocitrate/isopropylmalate dehydrogenase